MSVTRTAVLDEVAVRVVPHGRRLGVVVGIDAYDPASGIPPLRAAVADAQAIHALMVDPECGRFQTEHTSLLTDGEATDTNIRIALERLRRNATAADEVWFFFAGHALIVDGEHRLLPVNARREFIDATSVDFPALFRKIRCRRKIVFLDCCHAGATEHATRNVHDVDELLRSYDASGTITYCSSDGDQKSVELAEEGHGAFTYWLEKGLRGAADRDGSGVVTSDELWQYVSEHVQRDARRLTGVEQTPRLKLDASGAFPLSVNVAAVRAREEAQRSADEARRAREEQDAADIAALRQLLGDDDVHDLSTVEVKAARALLTTDATGRLAGEIRRALALYRTAGDRDGAVLRIRGALASTTHSTAAAEAARPTGATAGATQRLVSGEAAAGPKASRPQTEPPAPALTPTNVVGSLETTVGKTGDSTGRGSDRALTPPSTPPVPPSRGSTLVAGGKLVAVGIVVGLLGGVAIQSRNDVAILGWMLGLAPIPAAVVGGRATHLTGVLHVLLYAIPAMLGAALFDGEGVLEPVLVGSLCGLVIAAAAFYLRRLRSGK